METKTILIADDNEQFRQLMEEIILKIFPDMNVIIHHAETGTEAIAAFKQSITDGSPFDVVITDYSMPGATGSKVIEEVISMHPVPIIVVSAVPEAYKHDFIQEGAVYFLPKPFDIATAKKTMNAAFALKINPDDIRKAYEALEQLKSLNL
jgi:CheY-like chemotaxis protein